MTEPKFSILILKNKLYELEDEFKKVADNNQRHKTGLKHQIDDLQFSIELLEEYLDYDV